MIIKMCGIGGCFRESGLTENDIHNTIDMFSRGVCRGRDASGVMTPSSWWKVANPSPQAVQREDFLEWLEEIKIWEGNTPWLFWHTRAKTRGSERIASNNHPLAHGKKSGVTLIHNGFISQPNYFDYNVVDTRNLAYLIAELREKEGMSLLEASRTALVSVNGRVASAVADREGKEFVIMKDDNLGGSPIHYYWNKEVNALQWASTKDINGKAYVGQVGKKIGDTREFHLGHWQSLWWSGSGKVKRVWHKEKHGGYEELVRKPLPNKVDLSKYTPKSKEECGFKLRATTTYTWGRTQRSQVKNTSLNLTQYTEDTYYDYFNKQNKSRDLYANQFNWETMEWNEAESCDINETEYEVLGAYHQKWKGYRDSKWSSHLYKSLNRLVSKNKFVGIIKSDRHNHTMKVLLTNGKVRTYKRGKNSAVLFQDDNQK